MKLAKGSGFQSTPRTTTYNSVWLLCAPTSSEKQRTSGGILAVLSLTNGVQIWQSSVQALHTGPPSLANGVLYSPQGDQLRAVRASDGEQLDVQTVPSDVYLGEVAISDGQVFVSTGNEGLHAYGL